MRPGHLSLIALIARTAATLAPVSVGAQATDVMIRENVNTVSGVVHDSIARRPLAGATVQLVATDSIGRFGRTTVSDSLGRFSIADVPEGRYRLGFFHAKLDSLGVDAPLREVYVDRPLRVDLAIPSPARLRSAICQAQSAPDSAAVVLGTVRDARDQTPAAGVRVSAQWLELTITPQGMIRHLPRRVFMTGEKGWFALCDVPSRGTVALLASRGPDSTDIIELQVTAEGLLRRELYLGPMRTVVIEDTTRRADSLAPRTRRLRIGDGRLSGTVVAAVGGQPLAGALVSIGTGPQTRTNETGEWTLVDVPLGTRMLEVRAVGYYPEQRPVDVVEGAAHVRVQLSTLRAVLDTVKIRARYQYARDRNAFLQRRRTGVGRYMTAAEIARRNVSVTSDLFRVMPGVRFDFGEFGPQILLRGAFAEACAPAIFLDGYFMHNFSAEDIDEWVRPSDVVGIEVYTENVPPQFQQGLSGCGSIVIWTK